MEWSYQGPLVLTIKLIYFKKTGCVLCVMCIYLAVRLNPRLHYLYHIVTYIVIYYYCYAIYSFMQISQVAAQVYSYVAISQTK